MAEVIRKANPTADEVHVNAILTNISVAYIQDTTGFIADKVFPIVPVSKQSDKYFVYNQNDWMRDEAEKRAPSTESAGGGYRHSTDNYSCDIWAFHKDIDAVVRANYDNPLDPERDSAELVTQKLLIKREREFVTNYMSTGVWDTDLSGGSDGGGGDFVYFDDKANSDPIGLITEEKRAIKKATGFMPNILAIGGEVWDALKQHPDIIERIKYTQNAINISPQLVAQALEVDNLVIAEGIYATNEEGATANYSQIVGDDMLLAYAPSSPSLLKPAAGYTFAWTGYGEGNGYGVNQYSFYLPAIKSTRIEGEMAFDQKVVASSLGIFFNDVIS
ncbi:MAG: major capsid protein [Thermoplasmatota archaeon]